MKSLIVGALFFIPTHGDGERILIENDEGNTVTVPLNHEQVIVLPSGGNVALFRFDGKWYVEESNK